MTARRCALAFPVIVLAVLGLPSRPTASILGVPGRTGGFGETTCRECHQGADLNEPPGRLTVEGVPDAYEPGRIYQIRITLARPGLMRGGFQASAREDGINMNAGNNAGALEPVDDRTETLAAAVGRVTYLQHSRTGLQATGGAARWTFGWMAPDEGPVSLHVAAVAANGDGLPEGDRVYTAQARTRRSTR